MAEPTKFAVPGVIAINRGEGGLERVVVTGKLAAGEVYLHGAHVTSWTPAGGEPVLFMSAASSYEHGKPIRGGVPVIFPWFGPRKGHTESPIHGLARTGTWSLAEARELPDGSVAVVLTLASNDATQIVWPHEFTLRLTVRFGSELQIALEVTNAGAAEFDFEEAMHTYFAVGDVRQIRISGLAGATYIDKTDNASRKVQGAEPVVFTGETDRVYLATTSTCVIDDPAMHRKITIAKQGSDATVVWNPWINKARAMADFGDDEWPGMVCVETANAGDHAINLPAGKTHEMSVTISVSKGV